jgi:CelD/BcsL family acetyltransferase involved in cellulose biosynthesis
VSVEVELFDDWGAVAADAAGALDRQPERTLFERLDWFRLLAEHCPPRGKLLAIRARRGEANAWLFLAADDGKAKAYANWYSLRFDALGDATLFPAIAAALRGKGIGRVELAPLERPEALRGAFRRAGWATFVEPATVNWRVETASMDFAAFWAKRPGRLRSTAERKSRQAALDIVVHRRFEPEAWADYEAVYRASWKPEEGSAAFLRALAEQEGAAGALRLGIARHRGRPVAAQLWLVEDGVATIHKLAYIQEAKAMSPGTVLSMAMFRHVLDEDRVRTIDYGTGDDAYKRDWMEERRLLWRLRAYNPRTLNGLSGAAKAAAASLIGQVRRQ